MCIEACTQGVKSEFCKKLGKKSGFGAKVTFLTFALLAETYLLQNVIS